MGLSFFQILSTTNNIPDEKASRVGIVSDIAAGSTDAGNLQTDGKPKVKTPLLLGHTPKSSGFRNTKSPASTSAFQAAFERQAALEQIGVAMKIHGNPVLLAEMSILPNDVAGGVSGSGGFESINPAWMTTPSRIKINVRTPVDPDDLAAGFEPFWYQGMYFIHSISNEFINGQFTQELILYSDLMSSTANNMSNKKPTEPGPAAGVQQQSEKAAIVGAGTSAAGEDVTIIAAMANRSASINIG